jgi:anaerobic magnesium-protoporphyrin IX monomethyl ester cyclase
MKAYFINYPLCSYEGTTYERSWIPLALLNSIALVRREGIEARLISTEEILLLLAEKDESLFFVSTTPLDMWQCPPLFLPQEFYDFCRAVSTRKDLYVVGYHGTVFPELLLQKTGARAVIRKEPEQTILEICKKRGPEGIRGTTLQKDGTVITNPDRESCDLTGLPAPAYDQIDFRNYTYGLMGWQRFGLFETSRGCRYSCDFCGKNVMYGSGFRQKTFEQVKNELKTAVFEYGVKTGYFFDLDFLQDKGMAGKICDYLSGVAFDFEWCCQARIDEVDERTLQSMAKAGCRLVHYGIETYRHTEERGKYRSVDTKKVKEIVRLTRETGIKTLCFYIVGFDGTRIGEHDRKTLRMMQNIDSSYVSLHRYKNYSDPGTVKKEMEQKAGKDAIDRAIFRQLCLYYLRPGRLLGLILREKKATLFKRMMFFIRTMLTRL